MILAAGKQTQRKPPWWVLAGLVLSLAAVAAGDSWIPPRVLKAQSQNEEFLAQTTPATEDQPAQLSVHQRDGRKIWIARLSNEVSPLEVLVCNDGQCVVTLDNWYGAGYGDDVVAFYHRGQQVRKYSLEEVLGVEKIDLLDRRISTSTSSRHWRANSVNFIQEVIDKVPPAYVIWLDCIDQWCAWEMTTGQPVEATQERVREWEEVARSVALKMWDQDEYRLAEIAFLGRLRRLEDRVRIEESLTSDDFYGGYSQSSEDGERIERIELHSGSMTREAADKALAEWDEVAWEDNSDNPGVRLGEVHGTIQLPFQPEREETVLHVYLIPDEVPLDAWSKADLVHRIGSRLTNDGPKPIKKRIEFRFRQVTQGRYWVKVVYDSAPPFGDEEAVVAAGDDDYQGERREPIEVKAGQVAEAGLIAAKRW